MLTPIDVILSASCYALSQAVDRIPVIYTGADYDDELYFKQVSELANACWELADRSGEEAIANCHWWSNTIIDIAKCRTLEEFNALMEA